MLHCAHVISLFKVLCDVPFTLLHFVGAGQTNFGLNWGNGFITDSSLISRYGLSDPNAFFQDLLSKPYVNRVCTAAAVVYIIGSQLSAMPAFQAPLTSRTSHWHSAVTTGEQSDQCQLSTCSVQVVLTPHVYPPSITKATFLGTALWQQSAAAFGYLQSTGYCMYGKGCRVFPVLVGETGSTMLEGTDISWHNDFADFLNGQVSKTVQLTSQHTSNNLSADNPRPAVVQFTA